VEKYFHLQYVECVGFDWQQVWFLWTSVSLVASIVMTILNLSTQLW